MEIDTIITALIASGGTGVVGIFATHFLNRKTIKSDVTKTLQETASGLTKDLREDNQALRADNKDLHTQLRGTNEALGRLEKKVGDLEKQMASKDETIAKQGEHIREIDAELQEWREYTLALLEEIERSHPEFQLPRPTPRITRYMEFIQWHESSATPDDNALGT